jgi:ribonuclease-3
MTVPDSKHLEKTLQHQFQKPELLAEALRHRSIAGSPQERNNQRLEFLGDRVLGLIVAHMLYETFPQEEEGGWARRHAGLVSGATLADVARQIELGQYLILSSAEESAGGRDLDSVLEDACEALIGALYLDGGIRVAERFIRTNWQSRLQAIIEPPKDAKTTLQEWAQAKGLPLPLYTERERTGPAHNPQFIIEASISDNYRSVGTGNSKKLAEQAAAQALLDSLD